MEPGTWVMMGVLVVALANMLPVAYELILSALQYVGLRPEKSKRLGTLVGVFYVSCNV